MVPFGNLIIIIIARKRSLGQGNMFTGVCLSTGGCLLPGGHGPGGVHGPRGEPGGDPPPDGYCCGRYASYWNAFLFLEYNSLTVSHLSGH